MVEARRRSTFHVPGEPLMVSASPLESVERFHQWQELTGLGSDALLVTPIVTTPLPVYPPTWPDAGSFGEGSRRWPGTRPEAMWHPLMWLPKRVALRYMVAETEEDAGDPAKLVIEADDAWAVRACMELTSAGFYDVDSGEWLDILSSAGLDVDDLDDLARVSEWLDGAPDPILDAIDLAGVLDDPGDPDWAFKETGAWMESLRMMLWATHSESLLDSATRLRAGCVVGVPVTDPPDAFEIGDSDDSDETLVPIDPGRARASTEGIAAFGADIFAGVHPEEQRWWDELRAQMEAEPAMSVDELAAGPITDLVDRLALLVEDFVPIVEETAAAVAE